VTTDSERDSSASSDSFNTSAGQIDPSDSSDSSDDSNDDDAGSEDAGSEDASIGGDFGPITSDVYRHVITCPDTFGTLSDEVSLVDSNQETPQHTPSDIAAYQKHHDEQFDIIRKAALENYHLFTSNLESVKLVTPNLEHEVYTSRAMVQVKNIYKKNTVRIALANEMMIFIKTLIFGEYGSDGLSLLNLRKFLYYAVDHKGNLTTWGHEQRAIYQTRPTGCASVYMTDRVWEMRSSQRASLRNILCPIRSPFSATKQQTDADEKKWWDSYAMWLNLMCRMGKTVAGMMICFLLSSSFDVLTDGQKQKLDDTLYSFETVEPDGTVKTFYRRDERIWVLSGIKNCAIDVVNVLRWKRRDAEFHQQMMLCQDAEQVQEALAEVHLFNALGAYTMLSLTPDGTSTILWWLIEHIHDGVNDLSGPQWHDAAIKTCTIQKLGYVLHGHCDQKKSRVCAEYEPKMLCFDEADAPGVDMEKKNCKVSSWCGISGLL
jgi:hypothetical protein